jgi:hypothetical protein
MPACNRPMQTDIVSVRQELEHGKSPTPPLTDLGSMPRQIELTVVDKCLHGNGHVYDQSVPFLIWFCRSISRLDNHQTFCKKQNRSDGDKDN